MKAILGKKVGMTQIFSDNGEIIPVTVPQGRKKDPIIFDTDEFPRETTLEKMAALKPCFAFDGASTATITAGSSSGRNDGAAAIMLASEDKVKELGLKPMAKILACTVAGVDPTIKSAWWSASK